jgi:hypothetical protein
LGREFTTLQSIQAVASAVANDEGAPATPRANAETARVGGLALWLVEALAPVGEYATFELVSPVTVGVTKPRSPVIVKVASASTVKTALAPAGPTQPTTPKTTIARSEKTERVLIGCSP